MTNGSALEQLVAYIERAVLPTGFTVHTNKWIRNTDGDLIAEFDVEIRGNVGTTEFFWLIECRDRPSSGAAPGSWIEQLVGRKQRFQINKVTAVSSSGFSPSAREFAGQSGIELREIRSVDISEFSPWLQLKSIDIFTHRVSIENVGLKCEMYANDPHVGELNNFIASTKSQDLILHSRKLNFEVRIATFVELATENETEIWKGVAASMGPVRRELQLTDPQRGTELFIVLPSGREVPVREVDVVVFLEIERTTCAHTAATSYQSSQDSRPIAQSARFGSTTIEGLRYTPEVHRIEKNGETRFIFRVEPNTDA